MRRTTARRLVAASFLVLGGMLIAGLLWDRGPRYLGEPAGYWFPRWGWESAAWEKARRERMETLEQAGPDVFPMLKAAIPPPDASFKSWYAGRWRSLPDGVRRWVPGYVEADWIRGEVGALMRDLFRRDDMLRAFSEAYAGFPEGVRWRVLYRTALGPERREILVPLARRMMTEPHTGLRLEGARELAFYARTDPALIPELVLACAHWSPGLLCLSSDALVLVRELAELGPSGAAFEPWLADMLETGEPLERACAAFTLPAIAPGRHPWKSTVSSVLPHIGRAELQLALEPEPYGRPPSSDVLRDLLPGLASLLDPEDSVARAMPEKRGPIPGQRPDTDVVSLVLKYAGRAGTNAVVVAPQLAPLARHREMAWSVPAAELLARLGPVAPETIPELTRALTPSEAAPAIVLLLAAYGRAGQVAVPELKELAADANSPGADGAGGREAPGLVGTSSLLVYPGLAWKTGRTNEWPGAGRRRDGVLGRATDLGPPVPLSELAREAIRRIEERR